MHKDYMKIISELSKNGQEFKSSTRLNYLKIETDFAIIDFYRGGKLISIYDKKLGLKKFRK